MSEKPRVALILNICLSERYESSDGRIHGRFEASVVGYRASARYDESPTTALFAHESPWAQFGMHAYYGDPTLGDGRAYGFAYGYQPESGLVEAHTVERYATGLKKVERALARLSAAYGRPQSLGQEVVYLMQALGVRQACWRLPSGHPGGQHRDWRVVSSMEDMRYYVDHTIDDLRERQRPGRAA